MRTDPGLLAEPRFPAPRLQLQIQVSWEQLLGPGHLPQLLQTLVLLVLTLERAAGLALTGLSLLGVCGWAARPAACVLLLLGQLVKLMRAVPANTQLKGVLISVSDWVDVVLKSEGPSVIGLQEAPVCCYTCNLRACSPGLATCPGIAATVALDVPAKPFSPVSRKQGNGERSRPLL